jgi:flagellar secretion chaperone FliS
MTPGASRNDADLRRRYVSDAVQTASPAARLGMLYDRLQLDLTRADAAFDSNDMKTVNDNLIHAQEILIHLRSSLRIDEWEGASSLASLYTFLHGELVSSNLTKDRQKAVVAAELIGRLADAWRKAADATRSEPAREGALAGGLA